MKKDHVIVAYDIIYTYDTYTFIEGPSKGSNLSWTTYNYYANIGNIMDVCACLQNACTW